MDALGSAPAPSVRVLTLATGNKCAGCRLECKDGNALADSHAEVLACRALRRYIWVELGEMWNGHDDHGDSCLHRAAEESMRGRIAGGDGSFRLLERREGFLALRRDVKLVLYVSDAPCGDASVPRHREFRPKACNGSQPREVAGSAKADTARGAV